MDRHLAAIVVVDVVGYSKLMSHDEADTLSRLFALREQVVDPTIKSLGGRIVKGTGDGWIAEFTSTVDAVRSALQIQRAVAAWPDPGDQLWLRIGVHVGDVAVSDGDVFGDTVNVAARLESHAAPGGVLISDEVHSQVTPHDMPQFADRGILDLKNIARSVRGWAWPADEAPSRRQPPANSGKPSVAVLPLTTASEEDRHIANGLNEDLTAMLSRFHWFRVIASASARAAADGTDDPATVAAQLGCRYLVDGSVRRSGNRIRVHTQLIDAQERVPLWAESMDRTFDDIFDLQDDIVRSIVGELVPEFLSYYSTSAHHQSRTSATAWENAMLGWNSINRLDQTPATIAEARKHFEAAKRQDPGLALAWAGSALTYGNGFYRPLISRELVPALSEARRALELDDRNAVAWTVLGLVGIYSSDLESAERSLRQALAINPSSTMALAGMSVAAGFRLDLEGQRYWASQLASISPRDPWLPALPAAEGTALFGLERYEECIEVTTHAIHAVPEISSMWRLRAASLEMLGRHEDAAAAVDDIHERFPADRAWYEANLTRFGTDEAWDRYRGALRSAGIPI